MNHYTVEPVGRNVINVKFDDIAAGWEQWVLLRSDVHHDSIHCKRDLEFAHLQKAAARQALILDFGDLFDAMQGPHDKRASYDDIRPEDVGANYFDLLVEHAAEHYAPFRDNFVLFARGNHESSVEQHSGTSLTSNLVYRMNNNGQASEHRVYPGGFGGWVKFCFKIQSTVNQSVRLKYFHGAGASAPVTKGMIETNRQASYLTNADIVVNGHNHKDYITALPRERLSEKGQVRQDTMWFVRTPGYKDEYGDGSGGWSTEKGNGPGVYGAAWLHFCLDTSRSLIEFDLSLAIG